MKTICKIFVQFACLCVFVLLSIISNAQLIIYATKPSSNINDSRFQSNEWKESGYDTYFNKGRVGIGTPYPTESLDIAGSIRIANGTQADKKVLTSDENGVGTWQSTGDWSLTGNGGTSPGTDFLGTTDANRLVFKVKNIERFAIDTMGNFKMGYDRDNIFIGTGGTKFRASIIGGQNTAIGTAALYEDTSGIQNTAIGYYAMAQSRGGSCNIAIGVSALQNANSDHNLAIGLAAGQNVTTGMENVYVGNKSGNANTTANGQTCVGMDAGINTTRTGSTYFGSRCGTYESGSGDPNTGIGQGCLGRNGFTGHSNTSIGRAAGDRLLSGSNNTFLGDAAGYAVVDASSGNTILGMVDVYTYRNLTNCVTIGYDAVVNGDYSNAIAIGYNAVVSQSNSMVLGNGSINVGIGTSTPMATLDINGFARLTPGSAPSYPAEGMIYANSADHHLYFYNGSAWKQLDN